MCSLTSEPVIEPVLCLKTGQVFERDVIRAYLESKAYCPFTKAPLVFDTDFVQIKCWKGPRANTMGNIEVIKATQQGLIAKAEEGWKLKNDAVELKQKLTKELTRQQASLNLIRKLQKERDHLRSKLVTVHGRIAEDLSVGKKTTHIIDELEEQKVMDEIESNYIRLNLVRKELNASKEADPFMSGEVFKKGKVREAKFLKEGREKSSWRFVGLHPLNTSIAVVESSHNHLNVANFEDEENTQTYKINLEPKHGKVVLLSSYFSTDTHLGFVTKNENSLAFYSATLEENPVVKHHFSLDIEGDISKVFSHPLEKFVGFVNNDKVYMIDLSSEKIVLEVSYGMEDQGWKSGGKPAWAAVHPDGKLLGIGSTVHSNGIMLFNLTKFKKIVDLESELVDHINIDRSSRRSVLSKRVLFRSQKQFCHRAVGPALDRDRGSL